VKKLSMGVVGVGRIGKVHIKSLALGIPEAQVVAVTDPRIEEARGIAELYGIPSVKQDFGELVQDGSIQAVVICSPTDTHARYIVEAARAGKHIFCEKPVDLSLQVIRDALNEVEKQGVKLMVGFNRRFAPHAVKLKRQLGDGPISMIYRVNAGSIPRDNWIQDKEIGGGRIIGETCHFIDFLTWLCGSLPKQVYAVAMPDPDGFNDTISISLQFANGSIGNLSYFSNGSKQVSKEYIEVYNTGVIGIIRDFRELEIRSTGKPYRKKTFVQDKGQADMIKAFIKGIKESGTPPISIDEIFSVSRTTFAALKSLRTRQAVSL